MEGFIILIVLALIGGVIVLPLAAFIRSGRAIREAERLRLRVGTLENDLRRLRDEHRAAEAASPTTATAKPRTPPAAERSPIPPVQLPDFLSPQPDAAFEEATPSTAERGQVAETTPAGPEALPPQIISQTTPGIPPPLTLPEMSWEKLISQAPPAVPPSLPSHPRAKRRRLIGNSSWA